MHNTINVFHTFYVVNMHRCKVLVKFSQHSPYNFAEEMFAKVFSIFYAISLVLFLFLSGCLCGKDSDIFCRDNFNENISHGFY